jgi:hypothetical protein
MASAPTVAAITIPNTRNGAHEALGTRCESPRRVPNAPPDIWPSRLRRARNGSAYWQIGVPSFVEPPPIERTQVLAVDGCVAVADHPVFVTAPSTTVTPAEG